MKEVPLHKKSFTLLFMSAVLVFATKYDSYDDYWNKNKNNPDFWVKKKTLHPQRGSIFDRNEVLLATTKDSKPYYPLGDTTFHVIGYSFRKKVSGGIEKAYNSLLSGTSGACFVQLDSLGNSIGLAKGRETIDPINGSDLHLTLDSRLQRLIYRSFPDSMRGAVVCINPQNGEVLAMLSKPSFNPNHLIQAKDSSEVAKVWKEVMYASHYPLRNRNISTKYYPGGVFTFLTAIAALESKVTAATTKQTEPCTAKGFKHEERLHHCWSVDGHGALTLAEALKNSCTIYFNQLGLTLGHKKIESFAKMFNLGHPSGIDLHNEKNGYLGGAEAHNKRFGKKGPSWMWSSAMEMQYANGYGQMFTPLQLVTMIAGLGNGSTIYKPRLLKEWNLHGDSKRDTTEVTILQELTLSYTTLVLLKKVLVEKVNDKSDMTRAAQRKPFSIAGIAASVASYKSGENNGMYVGFTPVDNPTIAVTVVIEEAPKSDSIASSIAGDIMEYYLTMEE